MKICFTLLYYNQRNPLSPSAWLQQYPIMRELPQAVARLGHQVEVVIQFPYDAILFENHVTYHFISAGGLAQRAGQFIGQCRQADPVFYEAALRPIHIIQQLRPDIIHFHGLILNLNLYLLQLMTAPTPVIVHYHGGYPSWSHRFTLRYIHQCLFTTRDHAAPFMTAGLLKPSQITPFMEVSTPFKPHPRPLARAQTGMVGQPVFLSVGRLHPIKDPLTMLKGFALIRQFWPQAQLYLYFLTAELLPEIEHFITQHHLETAIHLRGRAPLADMEMIYNSADFLLQASQREFSSYAVLEALACGVIPIVTDIPSFRLMTAGGQYGRLFPPGDALALARQVLTLTDWPTMSTPICAHFEQNFSYSALAEQLQHIYQTHVQLPT